MNIPKEILINLLDDLCHEYRRGQVQQNLNFYFAKRYTISVLFSIPEGLIVGNVANIVKEDDPSNKGWGTELFRCLKIHQRELGIDYD